MNKGLIAALCVALSVVAASGCSTQGQVNPDVMQIATAPLTCTSKSQCDAWWQRARTWVSTHSRYDVAASTDTLIQTAGPDGGKRDLSFEITQTPNNDGTSTIGFAAHCDSSLGCKPNPWEAGADFKQFVRGNGANPAMPSSSTQSTGASGQSVSSPTGEPTSQ
ncbi:hypothetical protein [Paraburkholderia sp. C35]|uniref:hypothetical protein n=1 Tax=Paraburkholderia sp. C35 TaxID=2126993 RepID=UPI000D695A29|nr:hypothetical protein [Paraburkholderia sp. C35]